MTFPSDGVIISLVGAIASICNTWMIVRAKKTVTLLEKNTNSLKDELVALTKVSSHAEGLKQGQEEGRT